MAYCTLHIALSHHTYTESERIIIDASNEAINKVKNKEFSTPDTRFDVIEMIACYFLLLVQETALVMIIFPLPTTYMAVAERAREILGTVEDQESF